MDFQLEEADFNEIFENIENIEGSLLDFERQLESGQIDSTLIHVTFRYAHNLKSLLAMADKVHCSKVIHIVESNFDLIRNGQETINARLIEKCLTLIDLIKLSFDEGVEDEGELSALSEELKNVFEKDYSTQTGKLFGFNEFPIENHHKEQLASQIQKNEFVYVVEKLISTESPEDFYDNMPIYEDIKSIGKLIVVYPKFDEIPKTIDLTIVKILFTSNKTEEELEYVIFDTFRRIEINQEEKIKNKDATDTYSYRFLILENNFTLRNKLINHFNPFGFSEIVINDSELIFALENRFNLNLYYDFIFLGEDWVTKNLSQKIRFFEIENSLFFDESSKIISVIEELNSNLVFEQDVDLFIQSPLKEESFVQISNLITFKSIFSI
jgi:chemotaxis protein histidine kinase CheA